MANAQNQQTNAPNPALNMVVGQFNGNDMYYDHTEWNPTLEFTMDFVRLGSNSPAEFPTILQGLDRWIQDASQLQPDFTALYRARQLSGYQSPDNNADIPAQFRTDVDATDAGKSTPTKSDMTKFAEAIKARKQSAK